MASSPNRKEKEDAIDRVNNLASQIEKCLIGFSQRDVQAALQAVAAKRNLLVRSSFAGGIPQQGTNRTASPKSLGKGKKSGPPPQAKPENKDARVASIKKQLDGVIEKITAKAEGLGLSKLPPTDSLVIQRGALLAALHAAKGSFRGQEGTKESQLSSGETPEAEEEKSTSPQAKERKETASPDPLSAIQI